MEIKMNLRSWVMYLRSECLLGGFHIVCKCMETSVAVWKKKCKEYFSLKWDKTLVPI